MRARGLAVVLALVAGACGGAAAATDAPGARELTLRLPDLPRGYVLGDDGGCGPLGAEGASERFVDLVRRLRPHGCEVQFERAWASAGTRVQPALVESAAVVSSEAGAAELLDDGAELARYLFGAVGFASLPGRPDVGDDARLLRTRNALVGGRIGNPGVAVVWRSGRVVSLIFAAEPAPEQLEQRVLELAATQQRRIENPTPVRPADFDDREVVLDNPRLGIRVFWLGRTFAPEGLPSLDLWRAYGPLGPGGGPGNRVQIDYYRPGLQPPGVILFLWTKPAWQRFTRTKLGRLVWASPCARATPVAVRGGRAVIYAGYAGGTTRRPCPQAAPDRLLAHVFFRHVIVAVNMPHCFLCTPRGADPYNTMRGLRAVVRSLRERR